MKYVLSCLILSIMLLACQSKQQVEVKNEYIEGYISSEYQIDTTKLLVKEVIPDAQTALDVALILAKKVYGKEQIEREKPYQVIKRGKYWTVGGSLPKYSVGGVFIVTLKAENGKVVEFYHGK